MTHATLTMALAALLVPQAPPPATALATLHGRVTAADTGAALRRAAIAGPSGSTITDDAGQFTITVPPSGRFTLTVSKAGYLPRSVTGRDGFGVTDVRLPRGGGITVRVVDGYGDPRVGSQVTVQPSPASTPVAWSGTTDDHGEFRAGNLAAGRYAVRLTTTSGPTTFRVTAPDGVPSEASRDEVFRTLAEARSGGGRVTLSFGGSSPATSSPATLVSVGEGEELTMSLMDSSPVATSPILGLLTAMAPPLTVGSGAIRGRVVHADGTPFPRASVIATTLGTAPLTAQAGADGTYEITHVPAGTWSVTAGATGFSSVGPSGLPDGRTLTVRNAETRTLPDVPVWRGSAIAGTVLDGDGDPVAGLRLEAWRISTERTGESSLIPFMARQTDERGRFRVFGLPPGRYYVLAGRPVVSGAQAEMRVFHPGVLSITDAAVVTVDAEREATGIDIRYTPLRAPRVRGTVRTSTGGIPAGIVLLMSKRVAGVVPQAMSFPGEIRPDGTFEVTTPLNPGEYVLRVSFNNADGQIEVGSESITVTNGQLAPVSIITAPTIPLTGRIVMDGDKTSLVPSQLRVYVERLDESAGPATSGQVRINDDWTFDGGVAGGDRRFSLRLAPSPWWLQSVAIDRGKPGADPLVVDTNAVTPGSVITVRLVNTGSEIAGRVSDAGATLAGDYVVAAFSTDRSRWHEGSPFVRVALPDQAGGFTVTKLPPGEYWITAVDAFGALNGSEWQSADLLQSLARSATRVTVAEAQRLTKNLTLVHRIR